MNIRAQQQVNQHRWHVFQTSTRNYDLKIRVIVLKFKTLVETISCN